jgi:hypothetical protein
VCVGLVGHVHRSNQPLQLPFPSLVIIIGHHHRSSSSVIIIDLVPFISFLFARISYPTSACVCDAFLSLHGWHCDLQRATLRGLGGRVAATAPPVFYLNGSLDSGAYHRLAPVFVSAASTRWVITFRL